MDNSHLNALEYGLHNEMIRLREAKSEGERSLRKVWVSQYEKQIADERERLGMTAPVDCDLTDEELMAEFGI